MTKEKSCLLNSIWISATLLFCSCGGGAGSTLPDAPPPYPGFPMPSQNPGSDVAAPYPSGGAYAPTAPYTPPPSYAPQVQESSGFSKVYGQGQGKPLGLGSGSIWERSGLEKIASRRSVSHQSGRFADRHPFLFRQGRHSRFRQQEDRDQFQEQRDLDCPPSLSNFVRGNGTYPH